MCAGILRNLGVFMGDKFGIEGEGSNLEDLDFLHADAEDMIKVVEKRDKEHELWGWKDPKSSYYIESLIPYLRNPYIIAVFRDPMAIAMKEYRETFRHQAYSNLDELLANALRQLNKIAEFITMNKHYPILPLSYEKALRDKGNCVDMIAKFIGVKPTPEAIKFIQPGRYARA
jgi:hypothetical protein